MQSVLDKKNIYLFHSKSTIIFLSIYFIDVYSYSYTICWDGTNNYVFIIMENIGLFTWYHYFIKDL